MNRDQGVSGEPVIDPVTFDASSPGNQAIQCTPQPAGPSGDVLPESTDVVSLLIKPAGTHHKSPQTFSRRAQPARRVDLVSKEIKAFVNTTDKALLLMQAKTHRCYRLVQAADRRPQMPPGFCQDDDVVHVPNIMNLSADNMAVHGVVQRQLNGNLNHSKERKRYEYLDHFRGHRRVGSVAGLYSAQNGHFHMNE